MKLKTFKDLLIEELRDIYDGEQQLIKILPLMADAAVLPELKQLFVDHLEQTENQIARLEKIFAGFTTSPLGNPCKTMTGLVAEARDFMREEKTADPGVLDAALIAAAQKIEHFEIAAYGTARTYAQVLQMNEAAVLLEETLHEEREADRQLNALAMLSVNPEAAEATREGKALREAVVAVLEVTH